jgi:hypothetical protein
MNRIERLLLRDKLIVSLALMVVIVGSWLYLVAGAGAGMSTIAMTSWKMALGLSHSLSMPVEWTPQYA